MSGVCLGCTESPTVPLRPQPFAEVRPAVLEGPGTVGSKGILAETEESWSTWKGTRAHSGTWSSQGLPAPSCQLEQWASLWKVGWLEGSVITLEPVQVTGER